MTAFLRRYPLPVLLCVSAVMLVSHLGMIQTNIMEARNLITAREMVKDGHWIFTTIDGMPRYEKPPLPTWLTAVSGYFCDFKNMFVLRLPVALVSLMCVYFFYTLMKKFQLKNNQPLHASLILITSFYIFFAGRDNQWDMYTHAFMVACIYFLVCALSETKNTSTNVLLSAFFLGCSFLSKGPVSLYGLFLSFLISYFITYRKYNAGNIKLLLFVLVVGLVIGLSWPLYVKYFDSNASAALSKQTENWEDYDVKPFWYYWSFFTQSGIWTVPSFIALMYFYMRRRVTDVKAYTFSFCWTITSLLLLSFIPEKKARYTLPILIPLAMNTSFYIQYLIDHFKEIKSNIEKGIVYFGFGLIALIAFAIPIVVLFLFKSKIDEHILWFTVLAMVSFSCAFFTTRGIIRKEFSQTFFAMVFLMAGVVLTAVPLSKMYYSNTDYYSAANLHEFEKTFNITTYEGDEYAPEIIWDYGDKMQNISSDSSIVMPADSAFGLLVYAQKAVKLQQQFTNYRFTKYAVVDLNAVSKVSKGYNHRLVKDYYIVAKAM